jgi:nitrile hydratase beta subunit
MEWAHDLGGREGFGPVVVEPHEPVFHDAWERVARALVYAAMSRTDNPTTSGFRHAIERMEPAHYLESSYYEHWLTAAATVAAEAGVVAPQELDERAGGPFPLARPATRPDVDDLGTAAERFAVGDRVRVRATEPSGHTRCPAYVRGSIGVVTEVHGWFSLPDVEAHSRRRVREATYSVRFRACDLWVDGDRSASVNVDLWDSYLESA